jgi:hypothetical protein
MAILTEKQKRFRKQQRRMLAMRMARDVRAARGARKDIIVKRNRRVNAGYLDDIRRLFLAGQPFTMIARSLGKDHTTIIYWVRKMGLSRKMPRPLKKPGSCEFPDCYRPVTAKGLCHTHYVREHARRIAEFDESTAPRCDHSTSRCECVNLGKKSYADYVRAAGMHLSKNKDL